LLNGTDVAAGQRVDLESRVTDLGNPARLGKKTAKIRVDVFNPVNILVRFCFAESCTAMDVLSNVGQNLSNELAP